MLNILSVQLGPLPEPPWVVNKKSLYLRIRPRPLLEDLDEGGVVDVPEILRRQPSSSRRVTFLARSVRPVTSVHNHLRSIQYESLSDDPHVFVQRRLFGVLIWSGDFDEKKSLAHEVDQLGKACLLVWIDGVGCLVGLGADLGVPKVVCHNCYTQLRDDAVQRRERLQRKPKLKNPVVQLRNRSVLLDRLDDFLIGAFRSKVHTHTTNAGIVKLGQGLVVDGVRVNDTDTTCGAVEESQCVQKNTIVRSVDARQNDDRMSNAALRFEIRSVLLGRCLWCVVWIQDQKRSSGREDDKLWKSYPGLGTWGTYRDQ